MHVQAVEVFYVNEQRGTMPEPQIPRRTAHPYQVEGLADLPDSLRQLAEQSLGPTEAVNLIFVVPSQVLGGHWWSGPRRVPEQTLLFTSQGVLHVQGTGAAGRAGQATYLRGGELVYVHLSLVLLYGRLELAGLVNGALSRIVVEYNTVGHVLLQPALHAFLRMAWKQAQAQTNDDQTDMLLDELEGQSFKFRSGLRYHTLQHDERLLGFVFQPRITQSHWRLFRRLIAPATLLALTDQQLVVIEENRTLGAAYGWIFTFCPRTCLAAIEARPNTEWQDLTVRLVREPVTVDRQVTVSNEKAMTWRDLWTRHGYKWHTAARAWPISPGSGFGAS